MKDSFNNIYSVLDDSFKSTERQCQHYIETTLKMTSCQPNLTLLSSALLWSSLLAITIVFARSRSREADSGESDGDSQEMWIILWTKGYISDVSKLTNILYLDWKCYMIYQIMPRWVRAPVLLRQRLTFYIYSWQSFYYVPIQQPPDPQHNHPCKNFPDKTLALKFSGSISLPYLKLF